MDNTIPFNRNGQLYLPLDLPITFDFSPECYAMLQLFDDLDYSKFENKLSNMGRPNALSAKTMMELILYARLTNHYSCRSMRFLQNDVCALWLLDGKSLPDHSTLSRFIDRHKEDINNLYYQMVLKLYDLGEISGETIFQDGTKVESVANKYTFVWRKAINKNIVKCFAHLENIHKEFISMYPYTACPEIITEDNVFEVMILIRRILRDLFNGIDEAKHGKGIRATKEEKLFRKIELYLEKWINL